MSIFINISMTHRKKIESFLEQDCKKITNLTPRLVESTTTGYTWQVSVDTTDYEITYSDLGFIILSSLPKSGQLISEVREIYQGDASEESYSRMINMLCDNLLDHWV
jgi:hypothetical protein